MGTRMKQLLGQLVTDICHVFLLAGLSKPIACERR